MANYQDHIFADLVAIFVVSNFNIFIVLFTYIICYFFHGGYPIRILMLVPKRVPAVNAH